VELNQQSADGKTLERVSRFLDIIRQFAGIKERALVTSVNNFPTAAGLASSASAFAALAAAAASAAGLAVSPTRLSEWARRGSGSAARSVFGGFVEMHKGQRADGRDAVAEPLAAADFWDLRILIAITSEKAKQTGSTGGMQQSRNSSVYYPAWVDTAEDDLNAMRAALLQKDFTRVGELSEYSCLKMHALALSGQPGLLYWNGATVEIMHAVRNLRGGGIEAYFTIDAGPQVKVLCLPENQDVVEGALRRIPGVLRIIKTRPGSGVHLSGADE
jgi:diphosphomevalonate decarboxylase